MTTVKSPSPDPDWSVVEKAKVGLTMLFELIQAGHIEHGNVADATEALKELIETEIGKL